MGSSPVAQYGTVVLCEQLLLLHPFLKALEHIHKGGGTVHLFLKAGQSSTYMFHPALGAVSRPALGQAGHT